MLLPTQLYILGGAAAVALSFLVVAFSSGIRSTPTVGPTLRIGTIPPAALILVSTVSFALLAILLLAGLIGSPDPLSNPLPPTVWTLWWVGFTLLTALAGNLWKLFNPWIGPYELLTQGKAFPPFVYPRALGCWPALALFFAF